MAARYVFVTGGWQPVVVNAGGSVDRSFTVREYCFVTVEGDFPFDCVFVCIVPDFCYVGFVSSVRNKRFVFVLCQD